MRIRDPGVEALGLERYAIPGDGACGPNSYLVSAGTVDHSVFNEGSLLSRPQVLLTQYARRALLEMRAIRLRVVQAMCDERNHLLYSNAGEYDLFDVDKSHHCVPGTFKVHVARSFIQDTQWTQCRHWKAMAVSEQRDIAVGQVCHDCTLPTVHFIAISRYLNCCLNHR